MLLAQQVRTASSLPPIHSLHKVQQADIEVNTIYFDEAHNSVQRNFFPATEHFSADADRCYFFTATPKHSVTIFKPGMNDGAVYGPVICNVPAPKLVEEGYILPPKVVVQQLPQGDFKQSDDKNLLDTIDANSLNKILVAARSTKQIVRLISETDFTEKLEERGYNWMYITSKTGAIINGKKVSREQFFKTLNQWGTDDTRFIVMHHSILSEGINVKGLEAVLFMRNMDYIGISQSIRSCDPLGRLSQGRLDWYVFPCMIRSVSAPPSLFRRLLILYLNKVNLLFLPFGGNHALRSQTLRCW